MSTQPALRQPLPPDVIAGMTWGPFHYRKYPVFSLPWLQWRFVISAAAVMLYAALSALGQLVTGNTWANAVDIAAYFTAGAMLMLTIGPALATWVRHRGLSGRREGWCVIIAVILGFTAAVAADAWASHQIEEALKLTEVPASMRKVGELDEILLSLTKVAAGFLYFACGGGLASLAFFSERRRLRARQEHVSRLETDMRLAVLQAQIEPHFLFNTLSVIRPLIRQDAAQAEAAIDALADHLRATIPQMRALSGGVASTLGQQLDICASYLALMQVRMGSRLHHEITVPAELRALEFPPLMLLSLVENAVKHGIEPKPGPGSIVIRATITGTFLQVSVADDGAGLKDGLSTGLGLANIREQLALRHAGKAGLSIAAQAEGGTVAQIVVPLTHADA